MVLHRGPTSVDLSMQPDLTSVVGICEQWYEVSTMAEGLSRFPQQTHVR